jgi:DNA (cytosine-5)-methyltransferase 1
MNIETKICDICNGEYPIDKHNFEECYSLDFKWDLKQMNTFKFIEVCSGAGGLSTGLMNSGLIPLALVEIDKNCCETLNQNHVNVNVINKSFTDVDFSMYLGKVDLLAGGVPCQAFSQAGNRNGLKDKRGNLLLEFIKLIHKLSPKMFMIENVQGLLSHNKGNTFKHILSLFDGYDVVFKLLNSGNYSVPQKRKRVFIIGTKINYTDKKFIFPQHSEKKYYKMY